MPVSELEQTLVESATEVLETMFFSTVIGGAVPEASGEPAHSTEPRASAQLSFRGNPSGGFRVSLPLACGRKMAASFLGLEEESVSDRQVSEVICELANMLCGSVLSRLERETLFELSSPEPDTEFDADGTGFQWDRAAVCRVLECDEGTLTVWLKLDRAG